MASNRKLTRAALAACGIYFDPLHEHEEPDIKQTPIYLQDFCKAILDFTDVLAFSQRSEDDEWVPVPRDVRTWNRFIHRNNKHHEECLKRALNIQRAVERLDSLQAPEKEWDTMFHEEFFKPFHDSWKPRDSDSRAVSRQKYLYDQFEYFGDKFWTLFARFRIEDRQGLSKPKPDRVFAFKIFDVRSRNDPDAGQSSWEWKATPHEKFVESFSVDELEHMRLKYGLEYCPFRKANYLDNYSPGELQCFPWFVIENKTGTGSNGKIIPRTAIEKGQCQAANASAAALMLLQTAMGVGGVRYEEEDVPPVLAMTTVGRLVIVWVAWYEEGEEMDEYRMSAIWRGDMSDINDILRFEAILENSHEWATRVLRPKLAGCFSWVKESER